MEASISGDIPIVAHESFKRDLDSYVATSLKTSASTGMLEAYSTPKKILSPAPIPEKLTDDSGRKSLSKSQSDSSLLRNSRQEDSEAPNLSRVRKESKVKEHFFKHFKENVPDQQEQTKSCTVVTDQQEQTTDIVYQKEQTKSSSDQQESTGDMVNYQEQDKLSTDITDQEKQTKSSSDVTGKQEHTNSSLDLVDQQEQEKLSADTTDQQEQEESATGITEQQKQTKCSTLRQMDMDGPYMKHTLKRQHKKSSAETSSPRRPSWSSDVSDFSHMPGTIKQFSKVCYG